MTCGLQFVSVSNAVFAIQKGGACQGGPRAGRTFNQFGESSACKDGKGGLFANSVYLLSENGSCFSISSFSLTSIVSKKILDRSIHVLVVF